MTNLRDLSTTQLRRIIEVRQQIEDLQGEIESILGGASPAQASVREPDTAKAKKSDRRSSPAVRARLAAAARARWKKAKAAGKSRL